MLVGPMRNYVCALIERMLPWYDPHLEQSRNGYTRAVRLRAIKERINAERVLADYRAADQSRHAEV